MTIHTYAPDDFSDGPHRPAIHKLLEDFAAGSVNKLATQAAASKIAPKLNGQDRGRLSERIEAIAQQRKAQGLQ